MHRRSFSLLALLWLFALPFGACRPAADSDQRPAPAAGGFASSEPPSPLDLDSPREIALGRAFAPDGSIQPGDRTASFAPGKPIVLSIESGDLPPGTQVIATWTATDGTTTEQRTTVIGGESYLTYTAPSKSWSAGAGRVAVRIGVETKKSSGVELPFEIPGPGHVPSQAASAPTPLQEHEPAGAQRPRKSIF